MFVIEYSGRVKVPDLLHAPVAQLDRVSGYEPEGRGFESLQAYHNAHVRTPTN